MKVTGNYIVLPRKKMEALIKIGDTLSVSAAHGFYKVGIYATGRIYEHESYTDSIAHIAKTLRVSPRIVEETLTLLRKHDYITRTVCGNNWKKIASTYRF